MRILYDSKDKKHKKPFGCVREGEAFTLCVHIPSKCKTTRANVIFSGKSEWTFELLHTITKDGYDYFEGACVLPKADIYFYHFCIFTQEGSFELFREGYSDTNMCTGEKWQLTALEKDYRTSDAIKGIVMYQIFPDRFCKSGSPQLDGKLTPYVIHNSTDEMPVWQSDQNGVILNNDFFGGNLEGIKNSLPYIASLGVSAIYLNPIFKAFSNHRYDTCSYKEIDPMLGTEADFASLCDEAHKLGIKIILDGVFSHTGDDSIYFDRKGRFGTGVCSNPDSPYAKWYTADSNGKYNYWWGIETLPCVNEMEPDFVRYVITDDDSVVAHWLRLGADGFRLDVADELPDEFIALLRKRVKQLKSDAVVIAEVWEDASNKIAYGKRRSYFSQSEVDSVMNYPFREAIISLLLEHIDTTEFEKRIMTICENYPKDVLDCLMNSLSTHDTVRIMTVLSGAPLNLNREECASYVMQNHEIQRAQTLIFAAVMLQFFLPGSACVYYGDEVGMFGFYDPFNRAFFDKGDDKNPIRDFVRTMAKLKNEQPALQTGNLNFLSAGDNVLCMEREKDGKTIRALFNLSDKLHRVYTKPLATHLCTTTSGALYVHKYGFVIY